MSQKYSVRSLPTFDADMDNLDSNIMETETWECPYTREEAIRRAEDSIQQIQAGIFYTNDEVLHRMNERIERRCKG